MKCPIRLHGSFADTAPSAVSGTAQADRSKSFQRLRGHAAVSIEYFGAPPKESRLKYINYYGRKYLTRNVSIPDRFRLSMPALRRLPPFILVVEDEALVRGCVVAQLEDAGFTVIEAANGDEALQQFEDHALVTTLFTDINMPGELDGLSLAHKISKLRPNVQLILTSGRGAPLASELPLGGQFLPKPYDSNLLTTLIRAA